MEQLQQRAASAWDHYDAAGFSSGGRVVQRSSAQKVVIVFVVVDAAEAKHASLKYSGDRGSNAPAVGEGQSEGSDSKCGTTLRAEQFLGHQGNRFAGINSYEVSY